MIFTALLCGLINSNNSSPLVAFSCRYYYPAGSPKTSVHQIYVSDTHGRNRRQITFDLSEKTRVQWVGRNRLAWIESVGISDSETLYGYHMPMTKDSNITSQRRLIIYNLQTGNRKIVARGDFSEIPSDRGIAKFARCQVTCKNDVYSTQKYETYILSSNGIKTTKSTPESEYWESNQWKDLKFDKEPVESDKRFVYHSRDHSGGGGADGNTLWITRHGRTVLVPAMPGKVWNSKNGWKCWFKVGSYAGSGGSDEWIYEVNWKNGTCLPVADMVLGIDFDPRSRFWAAGSNNKDTTRLGKLVIWQRELWCGDLKTGKQWRIAAGPVHGDSAVVQP